MLNLQFLDVFIKFRDLVMFYRQGSLIHSDAFEDILKCICHVF